MNDRFRYRVWDKTQNKWLHFDFSTYPTYQDRIWQALTDGETFYQCTGLKDKNEKLIYEGDIVRFKDCNDILVINYQKEMACFAPQFYCNGKYGGRLWFDDYDSFECQFYKSNNFEVIGNIYENSELLPHPTESEGVDEKESEAR